MSTPPPPGPILEPRPQPPGYGMAYWQNVISWPTASTPPRDPFPGPQTPDPGPIPKPNPYPTGPRG